jgi:hypothetical protein
MKHTLTLKILELKNDIMNDAFDSMNEKQAQIKFQLVDSHICTVRMDRKNSRSLSHCERVDYLPHIRGKLFELFTH